MRWPVSESYNRPARTKRTVLRFAWLPVLCDTDDVLPQYVWLERYVSQEEWSSTGYGWSWVVVAQFARSPFTEPVKKHG